MLHWLFLPVYEFAILCWLCPPVPEFDIFLCLFFSCVIVWNITLFFSCVIVSNITCFFLFLSLKYYIFFSISELSYYIDCVFLFQSFTYYTGCVFLFQSFTSFDGNLVFILLCRNFKRCYIDRELGIKGNLLILKIKFCRQQLLS